MKTAEEILQEHFPCDEYHPDGNYRAPKIHDRDCKKCYYEDRIITAMKEYASQFSSSKGEYTKEQLEKVIGYALCVQYPKLDNGEYKNIREVEIDAFNYVNSLSNKDNNSEEWKNGLSPIEIANELFKRQAKKESPIHERWMFIANNDLPKEEGKYYCLDKYGEQGWVLYGNSGAPNENTCFFNTKDGIQAKDIICFGLDKRLIS